jgi:TRAP-type C4-dicarboxylate transport system permease small subunit
MTTQLIHTLLVQIQPLVGGGEGAIPDSILDRYVSSPISNNLEVLSHFVFVLCAFMGLLGGLKIYTRMMNGDEQARVYAFRWLGAILAVLMLGTALQNIASSQLPMQGDAHVGSFMNK